MSSFRQHPETAYIHYPHLDEDKHGATQSPIYMSAGFEHESAQGLSDVFHGREYGYVYSRISNPSVVSFEQHVNAIEQGRACVATASGMAALSVILDALCVSGDHVISSCSLFGGTYYLLNELSQNQNITVSYVKTCDVSAYEKAINDNTKAVFCESIGNPACDVPCLKSLAAICKQKGIPLVVDGTVSTPYLLKAKQWGVSVIWHSATKWISGTGSVLGGLIIDTGCFDWKQCLSPSIVNLSKTFSHLAFIQRCKRLRSNKGAVLSPFHAYLLEQGLAHLPLRMQKHCENALALAQFLDSHDQVSKVFYSGLKTHKDHHIAAQQFLKGSFGALLSFRLASKEAAFNVINRLKLAKQLTNLGDAKTLVIHPSSTIYRELNDTEQEQAGVFKDLIRVSVGLEHIDDIILDFKQALEGL